MFKYMIQGFMLGIAYVAPIGMQNIYVINNAVANTKLKAYTVALITIFFDISLALACFYGMGMIMERFELLRLIILFVGSIAVTYIGFSLMRSSSSAEANVDLNKSFMQIVLACMLVTWANPQALIDGSLLFGGFRATLEPSASKLFIAGVCLASATWFLGITTIASIFKNAIDSKVIRIINIVCGAILIFYGLKLSLSFIGSI